MSETFASWNAPLSRRTVLRGAGAMMALPFLESWAAPPHKSARPPLRLAIYTVTGGTVLESWRMPKGGALPARLPSILRPLEPFRKDLLVLTGLAHNGSSENLNGHENCAYKHLTGAVKVGKAAGRSFAGISVDQAAARLVGRDTYLPSLEFGLTNQETRYSFRSANEPVPYEADPRLVFDRMFKGRPPIVPNWQRRTEARAARDVRRSADSYERSVVDSVRAEARSLRGKLGAGDREKLDRYLETVRSVETRIDRLEAVLRLEAADARDPGPSRLVRPAFRDRKEPSWKLLRSVYHDPERHAEYIRLMSDLLVMALQTDSTRVATVALGDDGAMFPGVVTVGYEFHAHTLEHQGNAGRPEDADPIAREGLRQIHAWYTGLFAETVRKMKEIDEGGSTLLDNTMLLYTSYMADGGHGTQDYPVLLAGGAGGTLRGGRQIDYPKKTPMSNLFVEMLSRMGSKSRTFGESATSREQRFDGRLPGLT